MYVFSKNTATTSFLGSRSTSLWSKRVGSSGFELSFYLSCNNFKESMAILSLAASNSASSEDLKEALLKVLEDLSGRGMCIPTFRFMRLITDSYNDR